MGCSLVIGVQQTGQPVDRDQIMEAGLAFLRTNLGITAYFDERLGVPGLHIECQRQRKP